MPKEITDPQILNDAIEELMRGYRGRDRARGMRMELSFEEFKALLLSPCVYCGTEAKDGMKTRYIHRWHERWFLFRNTIDRIDSAKGYAPGNCVPCCFPCSHFKSDQSVLNWLRWIHKIAAHTKNWTGLQDASYDSRQMNDSQVRQAVLAKMSRKFGR